MKPQDSQKVAALIFHSTNHWYQSNGRGKIFHGKPEDCLVFTEVYEDLDPGCCLLAVSDKDQSLLGSCFYHPRASHMSLGIMNTSPEAAGKGVAKALLTSIVSKAGTLNLPTRLVSSALNLDSFSLYTRQGFVPYRFFQDMAINVPSDGFRIDAIPGIHLRTGRPDDAIAIDALEQSVWNTSRAKDWKYFAENRRRIWSLSVAESDDGKLLGALASVRHPGSELLGPGVAIDESVARLLILHQLNQHRGSSPVVIVPSDKADLVASLYELGARNCELHVAQCLGLPPEIRGVVLPTFMPETA